MLYFFAFQHFVASSVVFVSVDVIVVFDVFVVAVLLSLLFLLLLPFT